MEPSRSQLYESIDRKRIMPAAGSQRAAERKRLRGTLGRRYGAARRAVGLRHCFPGHLAGDAAYNPLRNRMGGCQHSQIVLQQYAEAFVASPQCLELTNGYEVGKVWSARSEPQR